VSEPTLFKEHTAEGLHARLAPLGVTPKLARRLQSAVLRRPGGEVPARMTEVSPRLLERVRQATRLPSLTLLEKRTSPTDGFTKYLFRGDGPQAFEAVRIPLLHRPGDEKYVVCVSSQVGCAMGCVFCATGRMGFQRNLAAWEIVDQVLQVRDDSSHPVRGVVFMGMGEPFLNYERVMRAAEVLSEPCGVAVCARAITISTVGIVPMIRRFTDERRPYRLIVSLSAATSEQRRRLLPVEAVHPLPELMAAVRDYQEASRERVTLAWTLLAGVNTRPEDAWALAELTAGLPVRLDLIDVNDATGEFQPPSDAERRAFRDALTVELGMPVVRRYSGGQDVDGGCGMLAGRRAAGSPIIPEGTHAQPVRPLRNAVDRRRGRRGRLRLLPRRPGGGGVAAPLSREDRGPAGRRRRGRRAGRARAAAAARRTGMEAVQDRRGAVVPRRGRPGAGVDGRGAAVAAERP
jgi:23S rRNA (adenine2503-C2)-methyltransferase